MLDDFLNQERYTVSASKDGKRKVHAEYVAIQKLRV